MHVTTDLRAQAVDDIIQGLGAVGVHTDEELVLLRVHPGRTGLDVGQVDSLLLHKQEERKTLVIVVTVKKAATLTSCYYNLNHYAFDFTFLDCIIFGTLLLWCTHCNPVGGSISPVVCMSVGYR